MVESNLGPDYTHLYAREEGKGSRHITLSDRTTI